MPETVFLNSDERVVLVALKGVARTPRELAQALRMKPEVVATITAKFIEMKWVSDNGFYFKLTRKGIDGLAAARGRRRMPIEAL